MRGLNEALMKDAVAVENAIDMQKRNTTELEEKASTVIFMLRNALSSSEAELARIEQALEREGLAGILSASLVDRGRYIPEWPADEAAAHRKQVDGALGAAAVREIKMQKAADAIRTHVLGDNEMRVKATSTATNAVTGEDQRHDNEGKAT